jgi:hypothetical protein
MMGGRGVIFPGSYRWSWLVPRSVQGFDQLQRLIEKRPLSVNGESNPED